MALFPTGGSFKSTNLQLSIIPKIHQPYFMSQLTGVWEEAGRQALTFHPTVYVAQQRPGLIRYLLLHYTKFENLDVMS